jgi:SAM-dependent methyltransferase
MAAPEEINADMLAFWNGKGGDIWVARQEHTDITLAPVTNALLVFAAPRAGERVVDIGCGCGAPTLEFARAVGPSGRVAGLDISGPMLAEGERRASAAGIANVDWRQADPATAALDEYDLLISAFGVMFFGDRVAAFTNMRRAAAPDARMALVCWRSLAENPWMEVPICSRAAPAAAAEAGAERSRNVRLRRSRPRDRGCHRGRLGAAGLRETRHGPRYRRRPGAGGGCGSVNPNRRREQLAAQPTSRGRLGRRRLCSRRACALCGRCESAIRRDVVDHCAGGTRRCSKINPRTQLRGQQ